MTLRDEVAELFEEAQHLVPSLPWYLVRRTLPQGAGSIAPLVTYERTTCPHCGDPVEHRPGVRDAVHLGKPMTCADRKLRRMG